MSELDRHEMNNFGGGRGNFRGGRGGFGGGRGRSGGGGRFGNRYDEGPPESVVESGAFLHDCQGEMVYKMTAIAQVPKFNAPVYLENKTQIGKVEEILGPISEVYFSVKPTEGVVAASFKPGDKVYLGPDKLMPLQRFTAPQTGGAKGGVQKRGGRGGGRGAGRGRGGPGGGRGGRGGGRGRGGGGFGGRGGGGRGGGGGFGGRGGGGFGGRGGGGFGGRGGGGGGFGGRGGGGFGRGRGGGGGWR